MFLRQLSHQRLSRETPLGQALTAPPCCPVSVRADTLQQPPQFIALPKATVVFVRAAAPALTSSSKHQSVAALRPCPRTPCPTPHTPATPLFPLSAPPSAAATPRVSGTARTSCSLLQSVLVNWVPPDTSMGGRDRRRARHHRARQQMVGKDRASASIVLTIMKSPPCFVTFSMIPSPSCHLADEHASVLRVSGGECGEIASRL